MEQQPLSQIQTALTETAQRVNDWHQDLRQAHNLTNERLTGDPEDIWIDGGQGIIHADSRTPYFWRVSHNIKVHDGLVSLLQLNRLQEANDNPLIARLYYPVRDFGHLTAVSFRWESDCSYVTYESLHIEDGLIIGLAKFTNPGVLFPTEDPTEQILDLHFEYGGYTLDYWIGRLVSKDKISDGIQYANGQSFLNLDQLPFGYPQTLNPIPHLEIFGSLDVRKEFNSLLIGA